MPRKLDELDDAVLALEKHGRAPKRQELKPDKDKPGAKSIPNPGFHRPDPRLEKVMVRGKAVVRLRRSL